MARVLVLLALVLAACTPTTASDPDPSPSAPPAAAPTLPSAPPPTADPGDDSRPTYVATIEPISSALRDRMQVSHRPGCPLRWSELRHLELRFVDFDGESQLGELVVHRDHARDLAEVFRQLYEAGWPVERMQLVDEYEADDDRSMAANNTSAYNCRRVAGSASWSTHAYGAAIDLNPVQNPYVTGASIMPPAGEPFAAIDRSPDATVPTGAIQEDDVVVRAFASIGWEWGGEWTGSKDYQHFSASGR